MSEKGVFRLCVNCAWHTLREVPGEMLSDLLRYRLRLTGTKVGCNEAECGACTVLVDGEPILSCVYPAIRAAGKEITTIEGLACSPALARGYQEGQRAPHPLQEAFLLYGAVQCGFCTPGQILAAQGLLLRNADPTENEIRQALKGSLCRCGGYPSIIRAIRAAAQAINTQKPVEPPDLPTSSVPHRALGRAVPREDAVAKVTGQATYADDIVFEGMLHARVKRAEVPSAVVRSICIDEARRLPGVRAVLTAADIPGEHNHGLVVSDWPVMVGEGERVSYVGDAIAIVAAETREVASEALRRIDVKLELLPVVSDAAQARSADAPTVHAGGNLLKHIAVRKGNLDAGFEDAEVVIDHTFRTPSYDHVFMEPECSVARLTTDGRMEIYVGSQIPYEDRRQVARALGWSVDRVRVIGTTVGGGFGGKEDIAGQIHAALLARATGRPVKLRFDRRESLLVHPKRHATQVYVKLGARRDGTLTAVQTELCGDTGAYASLGEHVMTRATTHSSGPYEVPAVQSDCYAMYTNNPPAGAFRGFGVMQAAFAIESAMDMLSDELGLDPICVRKLNALRVGSQTSTGQVLRESVGLLQCISKVESELRLVAGDHPFTARKMEGQGNLMKAWGVAVAYKNAGLGGGAEDKAGAEVELCADGCFEVRSSSAELGQGLPTVLQVLVAELLDQSPDRVRVCLSDTDRTPDGGPTTASRQTYVTGNAAGEAAKALRELLITELAERHDLAPETIRILDGAVEVGSTAVSLADVASEMIGNGHIPKSSFTFCAPATQPLGESGDMHFAYSFAAQAAEVEVNTQTGEVRVLRILAANDVGAALNPLGIQAQVEGGIMMGIGHALTEVFVTEEGRVITDRLARYRMPSVGLTPEITSFLVEDPTEGGPFGAKGFGEIVCIPTIPAITNAIYNAVGVRVDQLPCEPERILRSIRSHNRY